MTHAKKLKSRASLVPLRRAAMSATAASRRTFPAWIMADESGVAFPAKVFAIPRVRDALVLRRVAGITSGAKGAAHGRSAQ